MARSSSFVQGNRSRNRYLEKCIEKKFEKILKNLPKSIYLSIKSADSFLPSAFLGVSSVASRCRIFSIRRFSTWKFYKLFQKLPFTLCMDCKSPTLHSNSRYLLQIVSILSSDWSSFKTRSYKTLRKFCSKIEKSRSKLFLHLSELQKLVQGQAKTVFDKIDFYLVLLSSFMFDMNSM